jgi:pimeloyl-ACP methyl ester carboxylesterase
MAQRNEYVEVNGLRLHYVADGAGELMLFLHGFPEFWYAWKDLLAEFGRDHLAVAPDLRGYNLSDKPPEIERYRVPQLVADVRGLADALGHERFTLVGHDWGGVVAWAFAAAHPERLRRLVILNAPHPAIFLRELRDNPAQRQASAYMTLLRDPRAEALLAEDGYRRLVNMVLADGLRQGYFTEDDRAAYLAAWSQPGALTGGLNYYRAAALGPDTGAQGLAAAAGADPGGALAIGVPTLVVWGERDTALLSSNLDGLDRYVPDLRVVRIPDAGHWLVHERPEAVVAAIRAFIG